LKKKVVASRSFVFPDVAGLLCQLFSFDVGFTPTGL